MTYTAPVIILIIAYLIFRSRNKNTEVVFGSLFFLVNIFLVLQLLPVGGAITADRYTYLSYAGLFIPFAFMIQKIWESKWLATFRMPAMAVIAIWILFLGYSANARTHVWNNSETLWSDAIKKYPRLPNAQNNLGSYYQKQGKLELAKQHIDIALRLQPDFPEALINRCEYFRTMNKIDSAMMDARHAIRLDPQNVSAHQNRGIVFAIANKLDSAMFDFRFVLTRDPQNARTWNNLGNLYMMEGKADSAMLQYNRALSIDPQFFDVLNNRGRALVTLRNYSQAINDLNKAIEVNPDNSNNYYFRMYAYHELGMKEQALQDAAKAQALGLNISAELMDSIQQGLR
jgi:tetratricopeptide (TPR) repeat protein